MADEYRLYQNTVEHDISSCVIFCANQKLHLWVYDAELGNSSQKLKSNIFHFGFFHRSYSFSVINVCNNLILTTVVYQNAR